MKTQNMIPDDHRLTAAETRHGQSLKTYDDGDGPLWLYSESLGPVGVIRAQTWEDAYEIAEDEFMAEAGETVEELKKEYGLRREHRKVVRDKITGEERWARLEDYPLGEFQFVRWETTETPDPDAWAENELFLEAYGFRPNGPNGTDKRGHGIYQKDLNGESLDKLTPQLMETLGLVVHTGPW